MNAGDAGTEVPLHQQPCYPGIAQAIRLLLIGILLTFLLVIPIVVLEKVLDVPLSKRPTANAFISVVAIGCLLMLGVRRTKASLSTVFPMPPIRISLLWPIGLTVIGSGVLLSEVDNVLRSVLPAPQWISDVFSNLMGPEQSVWESILAVAIVPPLTEEPLFRGLILRGFLSRYSVGKSVVVSAILFALFHLIPWQILQATIWGLFFGWLFVKTRSLLPCLFAHALANSLGLLISRLPVEIQGLTGDMAGQVRFQPLWLDLTALLLVIIGLAMLVRMFGTGGPDKAPDPNAGRDL